ncbi:E3 ubiquitin-protein ligase parkin isoform X2 [Solea solea]|uniref:E3 ubiquitin-protein ligase parkin isoform X2 n=1 Tax=Solea solea TaxID=90069 RepID=UPI00272D0BC8|nr:E3 ubiquitin-protein ligase parkin isoform X2 [Solea solea]
MTALYGDYRTQRAPRLTDRQHTETEGRNMVIVFVRFDLGPAVAVELQEEASVAELKDAVASRHGVHPDTLRVLFAGRELRSEVTLQGCDLPDQSTIHVIRPSSASSSSSQQLPLQESKSLTRVDLSFSRLPSTREEETREEETAEETQAGGHKGVHTCSTFFVYCKTCGSVEPGKLRVRCSKCKETTITLSRDPSCWDDVLLPGRIHGMCQSDGCDGNEAEFFMKCASHPTSDDEPSVALDLIMTNTRDVPCIACTDIMDVVLVFQCPERHVICLDCFRRYCETRLNERQFVHHRDIGYSLPCTAGCSDSLIKEIHHFRVLGNEQYGRYLQYGAEECLLTIGGLMCPSPGCGAGLVPADDSRRVECDQRAGCGFVFCRDCRGAYHQGACQTQTAQPTDDASQGFVVDEEACLRGRWDRESLLFIRESTKRCPQCSVPVERNGGCMHMQCSLCRAEWCWICGVAWNTECLGQHWFG